jgi:predicted transcriptional regulator
MSKKQIIPTESELEILQLLWKFGPCSVRFIHEKLADQRDIGYTTTLKIMQIMNEKGITMRDTSSRTHIYNANVQEETTKGNLLKGFLKTTIDGSTRNLVLHALGNNEISDDELEEIKALIKRIENK